MTYNRTSTRRMPKHDARYFWLTRNFKSVCQAIYLSLGYDKLYGLVTSVEWQGERPYPDGHC